MISNLPPVLASGAEVWGFLWGAGKIADSVLPKDTKLAIAVWLLDVNFESSIAAWPRTFTSIFNRFFGDRHFSLRCFAGSATISLIALGLWFTIAAHFHSKRTLLLFLSVLFDPHSPSAVLNLVGLLICNYVAVLCTRYSLHLMTTHSRRSLLLAVAGANVLVALLWAALVLLIGGPFVWITSRYGLNVLWPDVWEALRHRFTVTLANPLWQLNPFVSAFGTDSRGFGIHWRNAYYLSILGSSLALWLYAGSAFLLRIARRFDKFFAWFNRTLDIEGNPLSSAGLVGGALVAVLCWIVLAVWRLISMPPLQWTIPSG